MKPNYALNLSPDGIGLWHRGGAGWHLVGEVALDDPEMQQQLEFLRRTAAELEPSGVTSKLIIPNHQILFKTIGPVDGSEEDRAKAVAQAMEGATPYDLTQLSIDWQGLDDGQIAIAAVARQTLSEAESFAGEAKFNPVAFVASPQSTEYFPREAFFGKTACAEQLLAKGDDLVTDDLPVPISFDQSPAETDDVEPPTGPLVLTGTPEPGTGRPDGWVEEDVEGQGEEDEYIPAASAADVIAADVPEATEVPPPGDIHLLPIADSPVRTIPPLDGEAVSSRGQIILGLFLIALALVIWVSIFMRESVVALFQSNTPEPVVVVQTPDDESDPFAGLIAVPADEVMITGLAPVDDAQPLGGVTAQARLQPVLEQSGVVVDALPGARLGSHTAALSSTGSVGADVVVSASTSNAHGVVQSPPQAVAKVDENLDWLDALKSGDQVLAAERAAPIPLVMVQATNLEPVVSDMPGQRLLPLPGPQIVLENSGQVELASRAPSTALQIEGIALEGPRIRRGGTDGDDGLGAKRIASLPPRQDVRLPLSDPGALETIVAAKWGGFDLGSGLPDIVGTPADGLDGGSRPANLSLVSLSTDSPALDQAVLQATVPFVPVPKTMAELIADAEINGAKPINPPLAPGRFTVVSPLRPVLADRSLSDQSVVADVVADGGAEVDLNLPAGPGQDTLDEALALALDSVEILSEPSTTSVQVVEPILVRLRPRPPEPILTDPESVVAALAPRLRPRDVGNRAVATAAVAAAPTTLQQNATVAARQATQGAVLRLSRVNLIGISGTASNRQALVRLASGRIMRVKPGDRLDGGRVTSVTANSVSYEKNGRTQVLQMPRG